MKVGAFCAFRRALPQVVFGGTIAPLSPSLL